jgi:hypothetical protein
MANESFVWEVGVVATGLLREKIAEVCAAIVGICFILYLSTCLITALGPFGSARHHVLEDPQMAYPKLDISILGRGSENGSQELRDAAEWCCTGLTLPGLPCAP